MTSSSTYPQKILRISPRLSYNGVNLNPITALKKSKNSSPGRSSATPPFRLHPSAPTHPNPHSTHRHTPRSNAALELVDTISLLLLPCAGVRLKAKKKIARIHNTTTPTHTHTHTLSLSLSLTHTHTHIRRSHISGVHPSPVLNTPYRYGQHTLPLRACRGPCEDARQDTCRG